MSVNNYLMHIKEQQRKISLLSNALKAYSLACTQSQTNQVNLNLMKEHCEALYMSGSLGLKEENYEKRSANVTGNNT